MEKGREIITSGVTQTTPTKYTLFGGVAICQPRNTVSEIVDNIVDYATVLSRQKKLPKQTKVSFTFGKKTEVTWNTGVPKELQESLLTQGLHKSDSAAIGTWGQGGKIAMHSLGRGVKISTKNKDEDVVTEYSFTKDWLWDDSWEYNKVNEKNWSVQKTVFKETGGAQYTTITVENPHKNIIERFGNTSTDSYKENLSILVERIGEIYGLTFNYMKQLGTELVIEINGEPVQPKTYASDEDIRNNFVYVPGFEPAKHAYITHGVKITLLVGCLGESASQVGGIYFYGNGDRLFAKAWKDSDWLGFDATHPQKKSWQIHIFFHGEELQIPWNAPLKEGVNMNHIVMDIIRDKILKLLMPYVELMMSTHQSERIAYTREYRNMNVQERQENLVKSLKKPVENLHEFWKQLPSLAKEGVPCEGITENDIYDHGDPIGERRVRGDEPRSTINNAKKWLKDNGVSQEAGKTAEGRIKAHWAFARYSDPSLARKKTEVEEVETEIDEGPASGKNLVSLRLTQETWKGIAHETGTATGKAVKELVEDLIPLLDALAASPKLPKEISIDDGHREMLKDLIKHYGGKLPDGT